jgi:lysophospholipase L1-like esterase
MAPAMSRASPGRARRLGLDLVLAVTGLVVAAGLAEAGARLAGLRPERGVNPLFSWTGEQGEVWRFQPGAHWATRVGGHPVVVNAHGFRDRAFGPRRPGVFRILVLGDSVTFGHGQPVEVTYVRRLEAALAAAGYRVEVLNAGIPGWSTYQQRRFYADEGGGLDPDLVLVGFVLNDVTEIQRGLIELRLATGMRLVRSVNWLAERSAAVAALKRAFAGAVAPQEREVQSVLELALRPDAPEVRHALENTLAEMGRLQELSAERGAALGLVLFPFRFQLERPSLDAPQRQLRAFAEERGIPVLDTLPLLREHAADAVLMDADHLTPLGHRISAEAIAAWLEQESLLPPLSEGSGS